MHPRGTYACTYMQTHTYFSDVSILCTYISGTHASWEDFLYPVLCILGTYMPSTYTHIPDTHTLGICTFQTHLYPWHNPTPTPSTCP